MSVYSFNGNGENAVIPQGLYENGLDDDARRRIARIQSDPKFNTGVREALASYLRGEKTIPSKKLKRKYARTRA